MLRRPSSSANDLQERVTQAIREALELAYLGRQHVPAPTIAARMFESEPELMKELYRPWVIDRLTSMIHKLRWCCPIPFSTSANDLQERVTQAIREALELAYLGRQHVPAPTIAARMFESEPELMKELYRPWVIDRLTSMIHKLRWCCPIPFSTSANDLQERVTQAIREALELAYLGRQHVPAPTIAARMFESEPELMKELYRPWVIDRLTSMIQRRDAWAGREVTARNELKAVSPARKPSW